MELPWRKSTGKRVTLLTCLGRLLTTWASRRSLWNLWARSTRLLATHLLAAWTTLAFKLHDQLDCGLKLLLGSISRQGSKQLLEFSIAAAFLTFASFRDKPRTWSLDWLNFLLTSSLWKLLAGVF